MIFKLDIKQTLYQHTHRLQKTLIFFLVLFLNRKFIDKYYLILLLFLCYVHTYKHTFTHSFGFRRACIYNSCPKSIFVVNVMPGLNVPLNLNCLGKNPQNTHAHMHTYIIQFIGRYHATNIWTMTSLFREFLSIGLPAVSFIFRLFLFFLLLYILQTLLFFKLFSTCLMLFFSFSTVKKL